MTKYAIIVPDGAADEPLEELGGKTPLEAAETPNMDRISARAGWASCGRCRKASSRAATSPR